MISVKLDADTPFISAAQPFTQSASSSELPKPQNNGFAHGQAFSNLQHAAPQQSQQQQQTNAASTASLLQALANMSKISKPTISTTTPTISTPPQVAPATILSPPQTSSVPVLQNTSQPSSTFPNNLASILGGHVSQPQQSQAAPQTVPNPYAHLVQPNPGIPDPNAQQQLNAQQQMAILQLLIQQPGLANLPVNQLTALGPLLGSLATNPIAGGLPGTLPASVPGSFSTWPQSVSQSSLPQPSNQQNVLNVPDERRSDRYTPPSREAAYRRGRSRSRSPGYGRRDSPPAFRRRSPTYDDYGNDNNGRAESRDMDNIHNARSRARGGRRSSPDHRRRDRSESPPARNGRGSRSGDTRFDASDISATSRLITLDPTVPPGHIKVLSRTLFVGGVA